MKLKRTPEFLAFLSTYFPDADPETDEQVVRAFIGASPSDRQQQVLTQAKGWFQDAELPIDEFGAEANRWFGDIEEGRTWLGLIIGALEGAQAAASVIVVKDSNGTPLVEGDSVQVIKDLKVKGGSSDLKRGTLVKKIHLIGEADAIECRVDGSTLVLKTCFLKKA